MPQRGGLPPLRLRAHRRPGAAGDPSPGLHRGRGLDAYFGGSYGIFAGGPTGSATLRFSPERARWVADEQWHPEQEGRLLPDGRYELRIPYSTSHELLMDILRHGPEVEVIGPPELRQATRELLARTLASYE